MIRIISMLLLMVGFLRSNESAAVQVSQNSLGEVLIYPYYTVNNNLNTLYSVVNTTDQPKAIRIRFQEGGFGHEVLIFSVYLDAFDVWTGALVATDSTIAEHVNEPSVIHLTSDTSCAPFVLKSGQEFLPFLIDLDRSNNNLSRAREGHLEVLELGVLTGDAALAVDHRMTGVPADCDFIENEWADDGEWGLGELGDPSGGLLGSATIVNVAEGFALPFDAIALQDFWQQAGLHSDPGSIEPNLSSAWPHSNVQLDNGQLAMSEWGNGYEAVSAVLMKTYIYNEYALDEIINGQSEWVVTFPTKKFHTVAGADVLSPFSIGWSGEVSCDATDLRVFDREEQFDVPITCGPACPPPSTSLKICYSSNVIEFILPSSPVNTESAILGSNNHFTLKSPTLQVATQSGWARVGFTEVANRMSPISGVSYLGLPMTGFAVQKFTNAGAADGLLAQYGVLFMHKSEVITESGL